MTITVLPMDATSGAPAYSAKNARQAQAAVYGNPTARVFGTRSGWRVGTLSSIVSVTSTTWTLNPCACMIEPAASLYQGTYGWASDQAITGPVTAADGTNPRVDILYIQVNDNSAGDGSGLLSAPVSYLAGTPAPSGTQAAPTLPARSFLVATIAVPKSGGGSPTVTLNAQYFVAGGGALPVANLTEQATLTPYVGMPITRGDAGGRLQTFDGLNWNSPSSTSTALNPNDSNWSVIGGITRTYASGDFSQLRAIAKITRVAGPTFTIGSTFQQTFTNIVPAGWRPGQYQDVYASLVDNLDAPQATLQGRLGSDGSLIFRINTGPASVTVSTNWKIFIDIGWWI